MTNSIYERELIIKIETNIYAKIVIVLSFILTPLNLKGTYLIIGLHNCQNLSYSMLTRRFFYECRFALQASACLMN